MLVLAPHPDDSILAVGGTMLRFIRAGGHVTVLTVAAHMPPLYPVGVMERSVEEARQSLTSLGVTEMVFLNIPALGVAGVPPAELNQKLTETVDRVRPRVLLVPFFDRHVDHRAVFESAMVASRPGFSGRQIDMVAAYETISATHYNAPHIEPNFYPNWTVDISQFIDRKLEALACCQSQIAPMPHPRSCEAVRALALFRGSQTGMGYAEAFQIIRFTCSPEGLN